MKKMDYANDSGESVKLHEKLQKEKERELSAKADLAYLLLQMMNEYDKYSKLRSAVINKLLNSSLKSSFAITEDDETRNKAVLTAIFGEEVMRD